MRLFVAVWALTRIVLTLICSQTRKLFFEVGSRLKLGLGEEKFEVCVCVCVCVCARARARAMFAALNCEGILCIQTVGDGHGHNSLGQGSHAQYCSLSRDYN